MIILAPLLRGKRRKGKCYNLNVLTCPKVVAMNMSKKKNPSTRTFQMKGMMKHE